MHRRSVLLGFLAAWFLVAASARAQRSAPKPILGTDNLDFFL